MSNNGMSVVIFVVFGLIVLAVAVFVGFAVMGAARDRMVEKTGNVPVSSMLETWWHGLARRYRDDHQVEETPDDIDDETAALLGMMPIASIVVGRDGEVVRSSPEAYRFNVVRDDAIVDETVLKAVDEVRRTGGRTTFDLTTQTELADVALTVPGGGTPASAKVQGVSRPNWLKVSVGRVGDFVVVMLDDVSDAVRFSRTRDSFITNVSEQLLQPTSALEKLARDLEVSASDPERIAADAGEVRSASRRLNRMVSDLLLLVKAQEQIVPSSANRLSLLAQVRDVADRLAPVAKEARVRLSVGGDRDLTVNGDGDQIRIAITKLVENAIGYSRDGGTVSVGVSKSSDGRHAVVRVIDQGTGIPKEDQERIFERFYRGSTQTDRTRDGIGLGLAIVKHVALTHHGSASVWSMPGSGSTFSFTLPLAQ
nr:HAMP domain-containing sensor histidine kinase [Bifidobacterium vespertilionis]